MSYRNRFLFAIVVCALTLGATPTAASPASASPLPVELQPVVKRLLDNGRLGTADKDLLRRHPEIAGTVLDPDLATATQTISAANSPEGEFGAQGGPGCWIGKQTVTGRYVSGGVAYRYTYRVDWCETSTAVNKPHFRNHEVELFDFMEQRGIIEDWVTPTPSAKVETKRKIEIENCPPLMPCWNSDYPWVKWTLKAGHISDDIPSWGIDG